jgi:hypothetical protein
MNDEIQKLRQEVFELKQRDQAMHFAYRVLARSISERGQPDLQYQQAMIRRAADELNSNPLVCDQVPAYMHNLADNLLSDHFVFQGMTREEANNKVYQIQNSDD